MTLKYAIEFVADIDRAVAFHRDILGLTLAFQTSDWSEFDTGENAAGSAHRAGRLSSRQRAVGVRQSDLDGFYAARDANGVTFLMPPTELPGRRIARFLDCEGAEVSVGG